MTDGQTGPDRKKSLLVGCRNCLRGFRLQRNSKNVLSYSDSWDKLSGT